MMTCIYVPTYNVWKFEVTRKQNGTSSWCGMVTVLNGVYINTCWYIEIGTIAVNQILKITKNFSSILISSKLVKIVWTFLHVSTSQLISLEFKVMKNVKILTSFMPYVVNLFKTWM